MPGVHSSQTCELEKPHSHKSQLVSAVRVVYGASPSAGLLPLAAVIQWGRGLDLEILLDLFIMGLHPSFRLITGHFCLFLSSREGIILGKNHMMVL